MASYSMSEHSDGAASGRFNTLNASRHSVLQRARAAAELTMPSVMPPDGATEDTVLSTPFQGLGAQGVAQLSSKLLQILLPIQTAFFNMLVDEAIVSDLEGQNPNVRDQINKAMMDTEKVLLQDIESSGLRIPAFAAIKNLIITGNGLLYVPDKGSAKSYRLDQYVVQRDGEGNVLEVVIKEMIARDALPEDVRETLPEIKEDTSKGTSTKKSDIPVYTWVRRVGNKMVSHQEILGKEIEGTQASYKVEQSPWIVMRWSSLPGENYGRGLIEELFGDIKSLEGLSRALVKGTAAASKLVLLVNPAGVTRPEHLARASTGDVIRGRAEDVSTLRAEKGQDFNTALVLMERIEQRLKASFLMTSSIQRDAERVTAQEIRLLANELESGLGGVYSLLSRELQTPLLQRLIARGQKSRRIPRFPDKTVFPKIVTGLDALGRGQNLEKLTVFVNTISAVPGTMEALNPQVFSTRVADSLGIDTDGLIKSPEQIAQEQQQAALTQAGGAALPGIAQEATKGIVQQRLADNQQAAG